MTDTNKVFVMIGFILSWLFGSLTSKDQYINIDRDEDYRLWVELMLKSPMDEVLVESLKPDDFVHPYTDFLRNSDIYFKKPIGFELSDSVYITPYLFIPNEHHVSKYYSTNGMSTYTPPFLSVEKDAMLLFPLKVSSVSSDILIEDEFMAVFDDSNIDSSDRVACIEDDKMKELCNIDRLYLYEYNIIQNENPEYRHCIGIVLRKKNHPSFPMKLLLTEEGLKNKDRYIWTALACIKYGDTPQKLYNEEEEKLKKERREGVFPLNRISNTGIRIERSFNILQSNPLDVIRKRY